MRGDIVYRIYGLHEGREKDCFFGAFRTRVEAEAEIAKLLRTESHGANWAQRHHNRGFDIREVVVQTDFEIPPQTKPRDRYFVRSTRQTRPGTWAGSFVEVFRRASDGGEPQKVAEYERNYNLLQTFEPFRQGDRDFALISRHYTATSVLDLATGQVIAEESPSAFGFCPVGFYVPDWWDVRSGFVIPGSEYWDADCEWPVGDFGFVWGCVWGDDSSWKVQHLDLSEIQNGIVRREERFGYLELAADGHSSPCFSPDETPPSSGSKAPAVIRVGRSEGKTEVTFAVEMEFDHASGEPSQWQRRPPAEDD